MITLIRWVRLKQLSIKWKLAIMHELDKQLMTIIKNTEEIEKKILPYLAQIIHDSNIASNNEALDKYREKVANEFNRQMNS